MICQRYRTKQNAPRMLGNTCHTFETDIVRQSLLIHLSVAERRTVRWFRGDDIFAGGLYYLISIILSSQMPVAR